MDRPGQWRRRVVRGGGRRCYRHDCGGVVHAALVRRWALSKPEASSRRALVPAIIDLLTGLFFWPFGFPGAMTSGAVVLGRQVRAGARYGNRTATGAVAVGVAGFAVVAILALLALTVVLPDWPPDRL